MPSTPSGFVPYTAQQELEQVQQVFINTFGSGVNLNPATINGVFIQQLTNMALQSESAQTALYSQVYNPNVAVYPFLDGICIWNNIYRNAAVQSVVTCQITGLAATVIPANSQILNTNGDVFYNPIAITIGSGGTATGTFNSVVAGPIACTANTVNRIVQQLAGWDTVNNSDDGITGTPQQTDSSLRYTRQYALAQNSVNTFDALYAAIQQQPTITNFQLYQNRDNVPVVVNGLTIPANGITLVAFGGLPSLVAGIIYNKTLGCAMGGNTTYTLADSVYPWVSFTARWEIPTEAPVQVNINIQNSSSYPSDIVTLIQNAVVANFNGTDNINQYAQIGVTIYASRFIPTLALLGVTQVLSCTIQTVTDGSPALTLLIPSTHVGTLVADNVIVTVTG